MQGSWEDKGHQCTQWTILVDSFPGQQARGRRDKVLSSCRRVGNAALARLVHSRNIGEHVSGERNRGERNKTDRNGTDRQASVQGSESVLRKIGRFEREVCGGGQLVTIHFAKAPMDMQAAERMQDTCLLACQVGLSQTGVVQPLKRRRRLDAGQRRNGTLLDEAQACAIECNFASATPAEQLRSGGMNGRATESKMRQLCICCKHGEEDRPQGSIAC